MTDHDRKVPPPSAASLTLEEIEATLRAVSPQGSDDEEEAAFAARRQAVRALRNPPREAAGSDRALLLLIEVMGDDDFRIRKEALEAALCWPDPLVVVERLVEALGEPDNIGRRNAAVEAVTRLQGVAVEPLLRALASLPEHRKVLVDVLGAIGDRRAAPALTAALGDSDPNVRAAAAEAVREAWARRPTTSPGATPPSLAAAALGSIGLSGSSSRSISTAGPGGHTRNTPGSTSIKRSPAPSTTAPSENVTAVTVTSDGAVWFGTSDRALVFRYDPKTKTTRAMADFAGNEIAAIAEVAGGVVVAANELADPVPEEVKQERYERFMQLAAEISAARLQKKVGREMTVLVDEIDDENGVAVARSMADAPEIDGNVFIEGEGATAVKVGEFVKVRITDADEYDLYAERLA